MPRFIKDGVTIETSLPRESAQLRAQGFKEEKARTAVVREADAQTADTQAEKPAKATADKSSK